MFFPNFDAPGQLPEWARNSVPTRAKPTSRKPHPLDREVKKAERQQRRRVAWTVDLAKRMLADTRHAMRSKAKRGIARWAISTQLRSQIHEMFGDLNRIPNRLASNMTFREHVGRWLADEFIAIQKRHLNWRWYSFTFIDDRVRTKDLITKVDLRRFLKNVRRMMSDAGITDWIGVVEFLPYKNWKRGKGRDLAPHIHIAFVTKHRLASKELEEKLSGSKRCKSLTEAPTVKITLRASTAGDVAQMAAYLFKGPDRAANAFQMRNGRFTQRDACLRSDQAVRVMEVLSQLHLSELVLSSGGNGKRLRSEILRVIKVFVRVGEHQLSIGRPKAALIWAAARRSAGKDQYGPVEINR